MLARLLLVVAFAATSMCCAASAPRSSTRSPATSAAVRVASTRSFVTIIPGDMPLILSAPHGGTLSIPRVDKRTGEGVSFRRGAKPNFSLAFDRNVDKLALELAEEIQRRTGHRPYVVVANFSRRFIDANRPAEDAYESPLAAEYYDQYHDALRTFRTEILAKWRAGFLLDLHGHGGDPGLLIRGSANWLSVRHLVEEFGKEAITGPTGLLGPLAAAGNRIQPSNAENEALENKSLNGGYIARHYGSFEGSNFDAIQFELGSAYRAPERIPAFARELADALLPFLSRYVYPSKEPTDDAAAQPTGLERTPAFPSADSAKF